MSSTMAENLDMLKDQISKLKSREVKSSQGGILSLIKEHLSKALGQLARERKKNELLKKKLIDAQVSNRELKHEIAKMDLRLSQMKLELGEARLQQTKVENQQLVEKAAQGQPEIQDEPTGEQLQKSFEEIGRAHV